jgi:hypothetical protein
MVRFYHPRHDADRFGIRANRVCVLRRSLEISGYGIEQGKQNFIEVVNFG